MFSNQNWSINEDSLRYTVYLNSFLKSNLHQFTQENQFVFSSLILFLFFSFFHGNFSHYFVQRSDHVWGHTPSSATLRRYSFGFRLVIAQADARPPCPYPSEKTPPDTTMKPRNAPLAWSSTSDRDKEESTQKRNLKNVTCLRSAV